MWVAHCFNSVDFKLDYWEEKKTFRINYF
nr:hypothetical protein [Sicyoidochytrium minutum DNA virus]